jgi:hypothetical protein
VKPQAFCHQCDEITATDYLPLQTGDIANVCAICKACRKGRPFITRKEFQQSLVPHVAANGGDYEASA